MPSVKSPPKRVCPICWKEFCKIFIKLGRYTYPDELRIKYIRLFHRDVCKMCKRLNCKNYNKCVDEDTKKLSKRKVLPEWWKE